MTIPLKSSTLSVPDPSSILLIMSCTSTSVGFCPALLIAYWRACILYMVTRIMTYYVGHSSCGLWGLVWSDLINLNYLTVAVAWEVLNIIFCKNAPKQAGKTPKQVWFASLVLYDIVSSGQEYIWFGFGELQKPYNAVFVIIYRRNHRIQALAK